MRKPAPKPSTADLSAVLIKLLQGFIYHEDKKYWERLLINQEAVKDYFQKIGLYLHLDETDGYAFLKSSPVEAEKSADSVDEGTPVDEPQQGETKEPATLCLMRKFPLSFELSLLCVLLREALEQYDETVSDDHRLILSRGEIYEQLQSLFGQRHDETKQKRRLDALINKAMDLGFLRELKNDSHKFEVRRVIKSLIDAKKLGEIKLSMAAHIGKNREENVNGTSID